MITSTFTYGNNVKNLDDWQKDANPWTITLKNGTKKMTVPYFTGQAVEMIKTEDVLWCLVSDANMTADGFDWFCSCYGYSDDSRKAETLYKQCEQTRRKLEKFLGGSFAEIMAMDEGEINELCK